MGKYEAGRAVGGDVAGSNRKAFGWSGCIQPKAYSPLERIA